MSEESKAPKEEKKEAAPEATPEATPEASGEKKESIAPLKNGQEIELAGGKKIRVNLPDESQEKAQEEAVQAKSENSQAQTGPDHIQVGEGNESPELFQQKMNIFCAQTFQAVTSHGIQINAFINLMIRRGLITPQEMDESVQMAQQRQQEMIEKEMGPQGNPVGPGSIPMPEPAGDKKEAPVVPAPAAPAEEPRKSPEGRGPVPE